MLKEKLCSQPLRDGFIMMAVDPCHSSFYFLKEKMSPHLRMVTMSGVHVSKTC